MNTQAIANADCLTRFIALHESDIRDFGCRVTPESTKRITVYEPLSFKAPSIARPYCCYIRTVIFYVYPYQVTRNGSSFREWDQARSLLGWDDEILFDGNIYTVGGGRVVRLEKAWWMQRWAKLKS